uniref:Uncharacterized protein n=2 Tax=Clastoptera arizonana TaxID=38151 RepID=A0A1B6CF95_9HEMI
MAVFTIFSSWDSEKKLENAVSVHYDSECTRIDNFVQLETCVELKSAKNPDSNCYIRINISESSLFLISKLSLVSEARVIELYGPNDEYISTCHAEYMDDFEDCAVYFVETMITPSSEINIKFARLKHMNRMWLYGIRLQLSQSLTTEITKLANINLKNVTDRLKDSNCTLSEKAESCRKFLQSYGVSESKYESDPQILLKVLESQNNSTTKDTSRNMSKRFHNLVPLLFKSEDIMKNVTEINCNGTLNKSSEIEDLKKYIDHKLQEIEQNLFSKIENQIEQLQNEQNQQYNNILSLLNSIHKQQSK